MNHDEIEEQNVAERYVLRRLLREEVPIFEEHLLECSECAAKVEACEGLHTGLRTIAADEASRVPAVQGTSRRTAWLRQPSAWRHAAAIVGMAAMIAALPAGILIRRLDATRRERDSASLARAVAEQRLAEQGAALERERASRPALGPSTPSPVAAPVFMLPLTRSAEAFPSDATRVRLRASDEWIVLALEYEGATEYPSYRVELSTEGGRVVWRQDDIRSASRGVVALSFHARLFEPGGYVVSLQGLASNGRLIPVGRYPFRIRRER
jgi:hypothetical protein